MEKRRRLFYYHGHAERGDVFDTFYLSSARIKCARLYLGAVLSGIYDYRPVARLFFARYGKTHRAVFVKKAHACLSDRRLSQLFVDGACDRTLAVLSFGSYNRRFWHRYHPCLLYTSNGGVAALAPAMLGGIYWKRSTPQAALWSIIIGEAVMLFTTFVIKNPLGIMGGLWGLAVALIVFVVVSLNTKPLSETVEIIDSVNRFFYPKKQEKEAV